MPTAKSYITVNRSITAMPLYRNDAQFHLFFHLFQKAYFSPATGIERGQVSTTYKRLADETGMTYKTVRTAMDALIEQGEVKSKILSHGLLLTVVNYEPLQTTPAKEKKKAEEEERNHRLGIDRIPADLQAKYHFTSYSDYEDWKVYQ